MQAKNKNEQQLQEIRIRNRIIFILIAMLAVALWKFSTYPKQLTVQTAPDISKAFVQKVDDKPLTTVYGFARTIWETIQFCQDDCSKDFIANLNKYRAFVTPKCYQELTHHFKNFQDLYRLRSRRLLPTDEAGFSTERVKKVSNGLWYTYQQFLLEDDIGGIKTRKQIMEYPLRVVNAKTPSLHNPWQLAIDCYWDEVKVTKYKKLEVLN